MENIKNDYVKRGITENDITLTDDEKTSARTWIGAVGNTDYAGTDGSPGIIRTSVSYGTQMVASGYIRAGVDTLETYKTRGVNAFIGKGTLENIKDDYVKRGITANTIALTDEEKAAAQAWLGVESSGGGDYLPLSGGTVNGAIEINSDKGAGAKIESPGYKQLSIISTSSSTIGFVFDVATKALCPIKSYVSSASGALGKSDSKWETIYATKLNNGADIAIPTVGGTMALQSNAVVLTADTVELATNTIYNADELAALTITLPTMDSTYISQLNFTSGATATAFTAPDTIKWAGDDITDNAFVPAANKRYSVMFYSDNVNIRAIVQGVE
ncbi:MAG: hypothetical protein J6R99_00760 [Alphaproteobacteria bacterium]|nr:hypothetical protein [Alphaproteobacteria bacterium]